MLDTDEPLRSAVVDAARRRAPRTGRFGRESHTGIVGNFDTGGYAVSTDRSQAGTYHVAGGEIILTYGDGRVVRWESFIADDGVDGATLWLGEQPAELADGFSLPPS